MREGFDPDQPEVHNPEQVHNLDVPISEGESGSDKKHDDRHPGPVSEEAQHWERRDYSQDSSQQGAQYGSFREERNVWGDS